MDFLYGEKVTVSREGHKAFDRTPHANKNRTVGEILGESRCFANCYRVKWSNRKSVDLIHQKFIKPCNEDAMR